MSSRFSDSFLSNELAPAHEIVTADDFALGMHCIGKNTSITVNCLPVQHISTPILTNVNQTLYEFWRTNAICHTSRFNNITFRRNDTLLFGVIEIDESKLAMTSDESGLRIATENAYRQIFSLLDSEGFQHLWRTWNYIPDIHAEECGLERYRQFNIGRHNAFISCGRAVDNSPAASALGTREGFFSVAFIAGRTAPARIENPRQISAFDYPEQYGPRSPTFTRAATVADENYEALFISGTASIVGHETLHPDNVTAQTQETIANLAALLEQANAEQPNKKPLLSPFTLQNLSYRIYIRNANDFSKVRAAFDDLIGKPIHSTYVQADICRQDLLIEIEAFAIRSLTSQHHE